MINFSSRVAARYPTPNSAPGCMAGFSLVEAMVGLTAGLLLIAGVGQIYLGSQQTYRMQEAQARLQEDGRFATEYLKNIVRLAGYRTVPWTSATTSFPAKTSLPAFTTGQVITGGTSSVSVRFQGHQSGTTVGCLGASINTAEVAQNTFEIDSVSVDLANAELECMAVKCLPVSSPPGSNCGSASTQPIVSNFGNLAIRYGLDTDGDRSANQYVEAPSLPSSSWDSVLGVRIAFELRSEEQITAVPQTYVFNGVEVTDRRLRRSFETTIALRNRLP